MATMNRSKLTYEESGVNIEAKAKALDLFRPLVEKTHKGGVLESLGGFGAPFQPDLALAKSPVLISSADSLGTKVLLHARFGTYALAGRDLVGTVVNDILCSGAKPLFFLDYIGCHTVVPEVLKELVGGMADACDEIGCALIGGETAEMPDVYHPGDFDLTGFAVGLVEKEAMIGAGKVQEGAELIGVASNGVHANGITLVRRAFEGLSDEEWGEFNAHLGSSLQESILTPTFCYVNVLQDLFSKFEIQAAANVTGGGLKDNLSRVIPEGKQAWVDKQTVKIHPIFEVIQERANISDQEMWRVFNMGVGFVLVVKAGDSDGVIESLNSGSVNAYRIGKIRSGATRFEWAE